MGDLKLSAEYTIVDQSLKLRWDAGLVPNSFPSVSAPFATSAVGALYAIKYEGTFLELSPSHGHKVKIV